ncbi:dehydrosqualene desaturase [Paraliobacillus quinghaiensis]|uniref:Dehydrosqualene desaturase n=1 Tax=Paraliobacillus quinghaiensis TaxID=470815 RepID=A0A917TWB9_9BACI|nr:phytoene desaturase family protein [Paraliobacillus quinghaiensis]GGM40732.1 dehydrosqualene desaturase [Paraliobacillus quinghaiensis]
MDIGIVGAGIGGLTAALLLEKQGHNVTIYEKEEQLGGRVVFQSNGEFKIDQGPTIVLLPEMLLEILEEAGISREAVDLIPCDPLYDIHYPDGTIYRKWRDTEKQKQEIKKVFPNEVKGFTQYMEEMKKIYQFGTEAFLSRTFGRKRDFLSYQNIKFILQSQSYQSVTNYLSKFFSDIRLRHAYALQTLYIGGAPHRVPALYGLISYSEHEFGIWYVKGGYASLIPLLEQACIARGVTIQKQTTVDEIVIENDRATGIKVAGDTHLHDTIVFNGDYPTIQSLIPEKHVQKKKTNPSSGCLLVYLGVKKRWEQAIPHQFFLSEDFDGYMKQVTEGSNVPHDASCYVFNPVALDDEAAPEDKSVLYLLIPVPANMKEDAKAIERLIETQIDRVEQTCFPELRNSIEWKDVRTPRDAEAEGLFQGGSFGIAPDIKQSGGFRPQIIHPTIKGLYAVGASVHPGGGIPIVMQGARLLSQHIKKEVKENVK